MRQKSSKKYTVPQLVPWIVSIHLMGAMYISLDLGAFDGNKQLGSIGQRTYFNLETLQKISIIVGAFEILWAGHVIKS